MLRRLEISAIAFHNNECWYFLSQINRLYYKNLDTGELKDCGTVPWEKGSTQLLYRGMEYVDGKIYLIPYAARAVAIYDTKNDTYSGIELREDLIDGKKFLFLACFAHENRVYAFGVNLHTIMAINTENDSIRYIDEWADDIESILSSPEEILSRKQIAFHNDKAYLPLFYGDALIAFDYKKELVEIERLNRGAGGYGGICCCDGSFWIADKNAGLVRLNCADLTPEEVCEVKKDRDNIDEYIIAGEEGLKIYTTFSDRVHITGKADCLVKGRFECICSDLVYTAFWSRNESQIVLFNGKSTVNIELPIEVDDSVCGQLYSEGGIIKESAGFGLKEYIADMSREGNE